MKHRNDGGYSLALVLVVMLVLATVATTLVTVVLSNIESQQQQMERVMDQYEAQGKLEKILSELSQNQIVEIGGTSNCPKAMETVVKNVLLKVDETEVQFPTLEGDTIFTFIEEEIDESTFDAPFTYDFKLKAKSNSRKVSVTYEIRIEANISHSAAPNETDGLNNCLYLITAPQITYKTIDVYGVVEPQGGAG